MQFAEINKADVSMTIYAAPKIAELRNIYRADTAKAVGFVAYEFTGRKPVQSAERNTGYRSGVPNRIMQQCCFIFLKWIAMKEPLLALQFQGPF